MADVYCTGCGRELDPDWSFCGTCGAPASSTRPADASATVRIPGAPPTEQVSASTGAPAGADAVGLRPSFTRNGLRTLGGWTEGVAWAVALIQIPTLVFAIRQRQLVDEIGQIVTEFDLLDDLVTAEDNWAALVGFGFFLGVASFVLTIIWLYRADGQVRSLGATGLRLARGFTIGGWFIPLANVVLLTLIFSDVERASRANGLPIGSAWRQRRTAWMVWVWTVGAALTYVAISMSTGSEEEGGILTQSEAMTLANGRTLLAVVVFVAAASLALYVRRVRRNLDTVTTMAEPSGVTG